MEKKTGVLRYIILWFIISIPSIIFDGQLWSYIIGIYAFLCMFTYPAFRYVKQGKTVNLPIIIITAIGFRIGIFVFDEIVMRRVIGLFINNIPLAEGAYIIRVIAVYIAFLIVGKLLYKKHADGMDYNKTTVTILFVIAVIIAAMIEFLSTFAIMNISFTDSLLSYMSFFTFARYMALIRNVSLVVLCACFEKMLGIDTKTIALQKGDIIE